MLSFQSSFSDWPIFTGSACCYRGKFINRNDDAAYSLYQRESNTVFELEEKDKCLNTDSYGMSIFTLFALLIKCPGDDTKLHLLVRLL